MTETFPTTHRPVVFGPNQPPRFYRGGAGIARFRGVPQASTNTPEDFVASSTEVFAGGGVGLSLLEDGSSLRDAVAADPTGFLGADHVARFGADTAVLVKLLDTGERLLVHFHPDGDFARRHLNCSHGKNEAWLITEVVPDPADDSSGSVFLGFTEAVSDEVVRSWLSSQDKDAMLGSLNRIEAAAGDTFFVPAGVPHAIGAGVTMVEVQEPVDFSILIEWDGFDIDGPNEGHLGLGFDTALAALDRSAWSSDDLALAQSARPDAQSRPGVRRLLPPVADQFFRAEQVSTGDAAQTISFDAEFAILVVLEGHGAIEYGEGESVPVAGGSTVLLPHGAGPTRITGSVTALRCRPAAPEQAEAGR